MLVDWPDSFQRMLDRLERKAKSGDDLNTVGSRADQIIEQFKREDQAR